MKVNEELLYYVWQYKIFDHQELVTTAGESIRILQYGHRNLASGPDFLDARVSINDMVWAGNIEFHVLCSDWDKHKHSVDEAYQNVILHIVYEADKGGPDLPTLELKSRIDKKLMQKYVRLMEAQTWIPCEAMIHQASLENLPIWSHRLTIERMARKIQSISNEPSYLQQDWEQLLYEQIAKYFGKGENAENFKELARQLPLVMLKRMEYNRCAVESIIFGCAGFLEEDGEEVYFQQLKAEFDFQKKKLGLPVMRKMQWKTFGMYPEGQPIHRLAQFAALVCDVFPLFNFCLRVHHIKEIEQRFWICLPQYWHNHLVFGKVTTSKLSGQLSRQMIHRLVINAIAPVVFAYARQTGDDDLIERCLGYMEDIPAEQNSLIKKWNQFGFKAKHAIETQALIELKHQYCDQKQCLRCNIGMEIIGNK